MKKFITLLFLTLFAVPSFAVEVDISTGVNSFDSEFEYYANSIDYSVDSSADFTNVLVLLRANGPGKFFWVLEGEFSVDASNISGGKTADYLETGVSLGYDLDDMIDGKLTIQRTVVDIGLNKFEDTTALFTFEQTMQYDDDIDVIAIYGGGIKDNSSSFANLGDASSVQAGYMVGLNVTYHITNNIDIAGFVNHQNYRDVKDEETDIASATFEQHDVKETSFGLNFTLKIGE